MTNRLLQQQPLVPWFGISGNTYSPSSQFFAAKTQANSKLRVRKLYISQKKKAITYCKKVKVYLPSCFRRLNSWFGYLRAKTQYAEDSEVIGIYMHEIWEKTQVKSSTVKRQS